MANRLDIKNGKFLLVIDDFSGGHAEGANGPSPLSTGDALRPNQMKAFSNLLISDGGSCARRGTPSAISGYTITSDASTGLGIHSGEGTSSGAYAVYNLESGPSTLRGTNGSGSVTLGTNYTFLAPGVMCDGKLIVAGLTGPNISQFGGTAHASYTTGTVTLTAGSVTVTGSGTTWTSAHVGSFFYHSGDSDATKSAYRIVGVDSGTSLRLERPFNGSDTGAAKTYSIKSAEFLYCTNGIFSTGGSASLYAAGRYVASAFGRLIVADTEEWDSTSSTQVRHRNRIRWSGLTGANGVTGSSTDGTQPHVGIYNFSTTGYLDFNGDILGIAGFSNSLLVFTSTGLYVCYGTPTTSAQGSLDSTTYFQDLILFNRYSLRYTPHGFAFVTSQGRAYLFKPSAHDPVDISTNRISKTLSTVTIKSIGYHDDYIIFADTVNGNYVYDAANNRWLFFSFAGQYNHKGFYNVPNSTVKIMYTDDNSTVKCYDGKYNFYSGSQARVEGDGTAAVYTSSFTTGRFGDWNTILRAQRARLTYRLNDSASDNPYLTLKVFTGINDADNTFSSANTVFTETSGGQREVRHTPINLDKAPQIAVAVDALLSCTKMECLAVIVEGEVTGTGDVS